MIPGKGLQQAKNYAGLLDLPFAYSTNGKGIVEDDRDTGLEDDKLTAFPTPGALWTRYRAWKGIVDDAVADGLVLPFNRDLRNPDGTVKEPRYYQRTAINRAVKAILAGDKRLLLTLATGTGKTFVSLQIVWKLKGEAKPGREIYFALYQALADSGEDPNGIFRDFAPNFFDLVIVDECHRGSARAESSWRAIRDHFSPAAQLIASRFGTHVVRPEDRSVIHPTTSVAAPRCGSTPRSVPS